MYFHECQEIEKFLVKLAFCRGIGLAGRWKIIQACQEKDYRRFSIEDLARIAQVSQYRQIFIQSYRDLSEDKLAQLMEGQRFLTYYSEAYPLVFKQLYQPPVVLFYEGDLSLLQRRMIAFVGARQGTYYARQVCGDLVPKMVEENFVIVSGLAKGVDSFAHRAAISSAGKTIAIVGTGTDQCYPRESQVLYEEIKKYHLLLSEFPPKTGPKKHHFPLRNRLIAGLAEGTCVIEAKERSGSLITAQMALEGGKEVFAVPGEIVSGNSNGCHRLIQDGAKCTICAQDILEELPNYK